MTFTLSIECDNAAFDDNPGAEIARILRELANRVEDSLPPKTQVIRDVNGNVVGGYRLETSRP